MTRRLSMLVICAASAIAAGCGPTAEGLKARREASDRLDLFKSDFVYSQAEQEFESGQFEKAEKDVRNVLRVLPNDVRAHMLLGRICLETQRLQESLDAFEAAAEDRPEHAQAHYMRGVVLERWKRDDEAYQAYRAAYDLAQHELSYLTAAAEALISMGDFDRAREEIEARLEYFEHDATLLQLLGHIALLQADNEGAVDYFLNARVLDPDDAQLLEELMWAQYDAGHYVPCRETIRELKLRAAKKRPDLDLLEARCLVQMDERREAFARYLELSRDARSDPAVWIELGTLAIELEDYGTVAECGRRAIGMAPDRYEGYLLKGVFEQQRGRQDIAIDLLREAAQRSTVDPLPMLLLGKALSDDGRDREALAAYHEALQVAPLDADAQRLYESTRDRVRLATAAGSEDTE